MQDQEPKAQAPAQGTQAHTAAPAKAAAGGGVAAGAGSFLSGMAKPGGSGNPLSFLNPFHMFGGLGAHAHPEPGINPQVKNPADIKASAKELQKDPALAAAGKDVAQAATQDPAAQAAKEPEPDPKRLAQQASLLNKSMKGWGTDESGLMQTLRGVGSAKELDALRTMYKQQYGHDLDEQVRGELGGKDLKEANKLLSGDKVGYAKTALENACKGWGTDEGKIKTVLNGLTEEDRQRLVAENPSLKKMISSELSGKDKDLSMALLEGDKAKSTAAKLDQAMNGGLFGIGTDEKAINAALEEASRNGNLSEVKAAYAALRKGSWGGNKTLDASLASELSGDDKKATDARMRGAVAAEANKNPATNQEYKAGYNTTFLSGIRNDTYDAQMHGQVVNGSANGYGVYAPNPSLNLSANNNGLVQAADRMLGVSEGISGALDPLSDIAAVTQYAAAADKIQGQIDPKTGKPTTTDPKTGKFDPKKVDWAALDKMAIQSNISGGLGPDGKPLANTVYDSPGQLATNGTKAVTSAMTDPNNKSEFIAITGHSGGGQSSFYTALKLAGEGYKNISVVGVDMAMTPAQRKMLEDSGVKVTNITSNNRGEGAEKTTSEIGDFIRVGMGGGENYYDLNVERKNETGVEGRHGVDNDANVTTMVRFAQWLDSQPKGADGKDLHGQFSPELYDRFMKENKNADVLQVRDRREDPVTGQPFSVITDSQKADGNLMGKVQDNRGKDSSPSIKSEADFKRWFDNFATGAVDQSVPGWVQKASELLLGVNIPNISGQLAGSNTTGIVSLLKQAGVDTSHIAGLPGSETAQTQIAGDKAKSDADRMNQEDADSKKIDPEAIKKTAGELFSAMDGWGTSEDKLLGALRSVKSPEQMNALRAMYKDRYNKDLDAHIKGELGGKDMKEAQLLLDGDRVGYAKTALLNAGEGMGTDETRIFDTLENLTERERQKLYAENGPQLKGLIDSEMSGRDKDLAMALLNGKKADAAAVKLEEAMHGGFLGLGTDEAKINAVLEQAKVDGTLSEVSTSYYERNKNNLGGVTTLEKDLKSELSGTDLDESVSLLKGDTAGAQMARLKAAGDGMGTDEKKIFSILGVLKDEKERNRFIEEYDARYGGPGAMQKMLGKELSGVDLDRAQQLKDSGKVDDETLLMAAMDGIGTDEELLKETMKGKSKAEIEAMIQKANSKYNKNGQNYGDFGKWMEGEVSGRDGAEIEYMLQNGGPKTPEEKYQYEKHMYAFERSNSNFISKGLTDLYSDSGSILDWQNKRMTTLHDKGTENGKTLTEEQKSQRLAELVDHHGANTKHYQEAKDSVADGASTVAGLLATGAAIIASGGTASALALAFWGSIGTIGTKAIVKDAAYSQEDFGIDVTKAVVEMGTAGVMDLKYAKGLANQLGSKMTTPLGKILTPQTMQYANKFAVGGLNSAPVGLTSSLAGGLLDEKNYDGKFWDGAANIGGSVLKNTAGSFIGGGAGELTKGLMPGKAPGWMNNGTYQTARGMAGGMAKGAGSNVFDGAYSGRWDDIAMNWGKPIAKEGAMGGLDGYKGSLNPEPAPVVTNPNAQVAAPTPVVADPAATPAVTPAVQQPVVPVRDFPDSPYSDADVYEYLSR